MFITALALTLATLVVMLWTRTTAQATRTQREDHSPTPSHLETQQASRPVVPPARAHESFGLSPVFFPNFASIRGPHHSKRSRHGSSRFDKHYTPASSSPTRSHSSYSDASSACAASRSAASACARFGSAPAE